MVTEVFGRASGVVGGAVYYAPPTLRTDWRTFARPVGEWNSPTRVSSQVLGGGSGRPCRPCRHRLAPIEALSVPHRQPGRGSRLEDVPGLWRPVEPASRPVRRGRSRSSAKRVSMRFSERLAIADRSRIPGEGKELTRKSIQAATGDGRYRGPCRSEDFTCTYTYYLHAVKHCEFVYRGLNVA